MTVAETIRDYYASLRAGDPLPPYFARRETVVKFGVTERLTGYDEVAAGLREQSRTTDDWTVESHQLVTDSEGSAGWFSDDVTLEWTQVDGGVRHAYETRWSGTLVREDGWRFVGMHVSVAQER